MPKQLFEEALADVRSVKQVAEANAKASILEAVEPRIRELIDRVILNEELGYDEGSLDDMPSSPDLPGMPGYRGKVAAVDEMPPTQGNVPPDAAAAAPNVVDPASVVVPTVVLPDVDGKVTLDLDDLCPPEAGAPVPPPLFGAPVPNGQEISIESTRLPSVASTVRSITERVALLRSAGPVVRATPTFRSQIAQMISRIENTYGHVQEAVADAAMRTSYETMLESNFADLNNLQESMTMADKTAKNRMNEGDVTLKLTGLPDDLDLEAVGVDLISDDDDEGAGDDAGGGGSDDFDFGADDQQGDDQSAQLEARSLDDDTIVEIDERMLHAEINRMRSQRIREERTGPETRPQSWGNGPDNFDNFGGGKDEGEPTDAEIIDKSTSPGALPLGEADGDDLAEGDELEEGDMPPLDQLGNRRKEDEYGHAVSDGHETDDWSKRKTEGLKRFAYEKKLQERAKARIQQLRQESAQPKARKDPQRLAEIKNEYRAVARRFNESVERAKKINRDVAVADRKIRESRSNSGASQLREAPATTLLRKKLAETNLFNAKLLFTNKLLQNEQLTARQKASVIKQLDEARTIRECRLVYESLTTTLVSSTRSVNEGAGRRVNGSSSRPTRPASATTLNEGYEAERWARLAGITGR